MLCFSASSPTIEWPSGMRVLIHHDGRLQWEPRSDITTSCKLDLLAFPFDIQKCSVLLGSPIYSTSKVNLTSNSEEILLADFSDSADWLVSQSSVLWSEASLHCWHTSSKCPQLTFSLTLMRRSLYYWLVILLPAFVLSVLSLVTFWVPIQDGSKSHMAAIVLLAFTAFLFVAMEATPLCPLHIPILGKVSGQGSLRRPPMSSLIQITIMHRCNPVVNGFAIDSHDLFRLLHSKKYS